MNLEQLNAADKALLFSTFESCCCAENWINKMLSAHPFSKNSDVLAASNHAFSQLNDADFLAAFTGHPQIGNLQTLKAKFANTSDIASNEQSGMNNAEDDVLVEMHQLNKQYLTKFGFIFIVCASGKSAKQMLQMIQERIHNAPEVELKIASDEQRKITNLRLEKLL